MKKVSNDKITSTKCFTAMYLKDIPGFISAEAPSSRLNFSGIYASTSFMSNQNHAYEE